MSIMTETRRGATRPAVTMEPYRPPYLAAAVATAGVFLLYVITLAPTTAFWDTSEYIATATIMGIPHPPGNPLFVVFARAWDLLLTPLGLSTAVRINLFSAAMGALAHGCWFLLADRILSFYSTDRVFRLIGASAAVLVSATAFTVWNQSNVNEKVYTVTLFTIALLSWLAFRWRDHLGEGKDDNLILLMIFILALSVGNHLMAFLAAPALVAYILIVAPRTLLNWRLYATGIIVALLGLSVHLYLPIRAGLNPVINEADPTCETVGSAIVSVATMGRAGCADLSAALRRKQYDKPSVLSNPVAYSQGYDVPRNAELLVAQFANYGQYFDWQWARAVNGLSSFFPPARALITLLFVGLGLFGAWSHYRRDRTSWVYFALLFATLSFGLTFYLNFKYGYTYPGVSRDVTEVRERDYFFIVSFSLWGVWAGIGIAAFWMWLSDRLANGADAVRTAVFDRPGVSALRPSWKTAPVLVLALIPLFANWSWADRSYDYAARDWAYNLLMSVEPYGVLFTNGDNDTFPLWYLQETEGIRRDVTVIVMSYLNTPWYARQLRDLTQPCGPGVTPDSDPTRIICQRPYDPSIGPDFYRSLVTQGDQSGVSADPRRGGAPTQSILPLSDAEITEITNTPPFRLPQDRVFSAHGIQAVLPQNTVMVPANFFMAQIIQSSLGDRPIYYAMTTQAYEELNLRPFLIRQGVALKLNNGPVEPDSARGIYAVPPSGLTGIIGPYIDMPRTETLLTDVFMHRGGIPQDWGHWVDVATEGIPAYYAYSHRGMALVYDAYGRMADAQRHLMLSDQWLELANKRFFAAG
ncbi:MAG: DUF2723 domain-containing protein, partial [Gemmatimonadetes bacterium]|nr:DUF2723 domain-containing protein [Gemmatimonadota bacterium]